MFGAGGRTRAQLSQLLGLQPSEAVLGQWRDLSLGLSRGSAQLNTANQLAVARGFKPKAAFNQMLGRDFQSTISEYDFAANRAAAVEQVKWHLQSSVSSLPCHSLGQSVILQILQTCLNNREIGDSFMKL